MTDTEMDKMLATHAETAAGMVALSHLANDLEKMAGMLATLDGIGDALAMVESWSSRDDLRKGIASAFLMRAKSLLVPAIERAGAAAGKWEAFRQKFATTAGDFGEAAGRFAASTPATDAAERAGIAAPSVQRIANAGRDAAVSAARAVTSPYGMRHAAEGTAIGAYALTRMGRTSQPKAPPPGGAPPFPRRSRSPA